MFVHEVSMDSENIENSKFCKKKKKVIDEINIIRLKNWLQHL